MPYVYHVFSQLILLGDLTLTAGDGAAILDELEIAIAYSAGLEGNTEAEILLFDMAK